CAVCLGGYAEQQVVVVLPCLHSYHRECITQWLLSTALCPLCKRAVRPPPGPPVTGAASEAGLGGAGLGGSGSGSGSGSDLGGLGALLNPVADEAAPAPAAPPVMVTVYSRYIVPPQPTPATRTRRP
ncbi:hypothetical protein B484DRAFT_331862, partial [Ochromonadaceae sp. CCMP2298]